MFKTTISNRTEITEKTFELIDCEGVESSIILYVDLYLLTVSFYFILYGKNRGENTKKKRRNIIKQKNEEEKKQLSSFFSFH